MQGEVAHRKLLTVKGTVVRALARMYTKMYTCTMRKALVDGVLSAESRAYIYNSV
jgi:hypothetical protein